MDPQVESFLPVFVYFLAVVGFASGALFVAHFLPKARKRTAVKDMPSGRPRDGAVLDRRCAPAAPLCGPGRKNGSAAMPLTCGGHHNRWTCARRQSDFELFTIRVLGLGR